MFGIGLIKGTFFGLIIGLFVNSLCKVKKNNKSSSPENMEKNQN